MSLKDHAVAAPPTIAENPVDRWQVGFEDMFALVASQVAEAGHPPPAGGQSG